MTVFVCYFLERPAGIDINTFIFAFGADGQPLPFPNNPASFFLPAQSQLAKLGSEIFGTALSTPQAGWIRVSGDIAELGCIYQFGDLAGNQLDGSVAATQPSRQLRFTRVFEGPGAFRNRTASTFLSIANPNAAPITMTLNLLGPQANQALAPPQTVTVPANGVLCWTVSQIFHSVLSINSGWIDVQVTAGDGAVGFEMVQFPDSKTIVGSNAVTGGAVNQSFSAQLAITPQYFTNLKLINTSTLPRTVTLHAILESGADLITPQIANLAVGQALEQDAGELFGLSSAVGSLRVDADGPGIIGDVIFADPQAMSFAASSQLQSTKFSQAVFSQVANGMNYFTGVALLNPNPQATSVTLDVFTETGVKAGSNTVSLGPGQRLSKLLAQMVPSSAGQMRGFVMMTSTLPIIGQELFGDTGMLFLSAIPPQVVK